MIIYVSILEAKEHLTDAAVFSCVSDSTLASVAVESVNTSSTITTRMAGAVVWVYKQVPDYKQCIPAALYDDIRNYSLITFCLVFSDLFVTSVLILFIT